MTDFTSDWEYWANVDDTMEYVSPSCEHIRGYTTQDFNDNPSLFKEMPNPLKSLQEIEKAHIIRVLEETNWRIADID